MNLLFLRCQVVRLIEWSDLLDNSSSLHSHSPERLGAATDELRAKLLRSDQQALYYFTAFFLDCTKKGFVCELKIVKIKARTNDTRY